MRLAHAGRNALAWVWNRLQPLPAVSTAELRHQLAHGKIRKILLIRPQQGLGDLLLATPVFRALKAAYPSCELQLIASPRNAAAVQTNPRLSKLWIWDKRRMRNPARCYAWLCTLRAEKYDLALILIGNAPSLTSFLIARWIGAPVIGSYDTGALYGGVNWSRELTNWQAPAPGESDPEVQKFFALVAPLVPLPRPDPEYLIPEPVIAWARGVWARLGIDRGPAPTAIFLGGNLNRAGRLWLPASWAELARRLKEQGAGPVVAVCPPRALSAKGVQETDVYQEFRQALGEDVPVFDEPGLPQAAAFLKPMALFICPDGGLFHTAACAGVRTLGLFFQTDPDLWKPPLANVTALRAPGGRPEALTVDQVLSTALALRQAV